MPDEITVKDGYMYGAWRRTVNTSIDVKDSIHDDETAKKVGMRGGAVAGTNHLDLFIPVLLKAFGQRWFEQGSLSIYYTYATRDREEVRAVIGVPLEGAKDVQVEAWLEMPDGHTVGKGTASVGEPEELSALMAVELKSSDSGEPRILAGLKAGDELPSRDVVITQEEVNKRLEVTTDPLDWYKGGSPWGGAVLPPRTMYDAMVIGYEQRKIEAVGFFGATELRNVNGPIKVGVPYRVTSNIVYVGTSPKTEYFWYDSYLDDKDGKRVAEMRHMLRFMKVSSPLYQDSKR
ncbi:hypothetical protein ACFLVG_04100 [Chloroflexota bacterium]